MNYRKYLKEAAFVDYRRFSSELESLTNLDKSNSYTLWSYDTISDTLTATLKGPYDKKAATKIAKTMAKSFGKKGFTITDNGDKTVIIFK